MTTKNDTKTDEQPVTPVPHVTPAPAPKTDDVAAVSRLGAIIGDQLKGLEKKFDAEIAEIKKAVTPAAPPAPVAPAPIVETPKKGFLSEVADELGKMTGLGA